MKPVVAVGDTHGELGKVQRLVEILDARGYFESHTIVFLGDYLDRGPNISGLIELLIQLTKLGHVCIAGNHEFVLKKAMTLNRGELKEAWSEVWFRGYERETLASYGIGYLKRVGLSDLSEATELLKIKLIERGHYDFLVSLPLYYEQDDMIFVHAGIRSNVTWELQKEELRVADEPPQVFSAQLGRQINHNDDKIVVSGHTRVREPIITPKRVMLDCGAGMGGKLAAWVSDTNEIILI